MGIKTLAKMSIAGIILFMTLKYPLLFIVVAAIFAIHDDMERNNEED